MLKVTSVETKQGTSKAGKPYTLYKIELEDGNKASGFEKVEVGDSVTIFTNDNGYNGYEKVESKAPANAPSSTPQPGSLASKQAEATMARIANSLEDIAASLSILAGKKLESKPAAKPEVEPKPEVEDEVVLPEDF